MSVLVSICFNSVPPSPLPPPRRDRVILKIYFLSLKFFFGGWHLYAWPSLTSRSSSSVSSFNHLLPSSSLVYSQNIAHNNRPLFENRDSGLEKSEEQKIERLRYYATDFCSLQSLYLVLPRPLLYYRKTSI